MIEDKDDKKPSKLNFAYSSCQKLKYPNSATWACSILWTF